MKLLLTLVSTNENKTVVDILAQLAADSLEQKNMEKISAPRSGRIGSLVKNKLIKGMAKTVELIGEEAVNSVFTMLKPKLSRIINENLQQNKIPAVFSVEEIITDLDKINITVNLDSINYTGVINRFLPDILYSLRENDPDNYMWRVYDVISDEQPRIVKAVMDTINNEKKEEIIEMMILQNKDSLCDKVSDLLAAENIEISVDNIYVTLDHQAPYEC